LTQQQGESGKAVGTSGKKWGRSREGKGKEIGKGIVPLLLLF
jgi:hypothetical protein